MKNCPCGTEFLYTDCCGPLIRGVGHADSAEDLMRSRYTAFTLKNWEYLKNSLCPDERSLVMDFESSQKDICWERLEVLESKRGGVFDKDGEVTFKAYFEQAGIKKTLEETAKFLKVQGKWFYSQRRSKTISEVKSISKNPLKHKKNKIGRNEPCPCNSGKKFKKCCGK